MMNLNEQETQRLKSVSKKVAKVLLAGFAYYIFVTLTHLYIPCIFRVMTGWLCPGCGISHMFVALAHLDLRGAYGENAFIFILLPFAAVYCGWKAWQYIKTGEREVKVWETVLFAVLFAGAVAFAVYRNWGTAPAFVWERIYKFMAERAGFTQ